MLQRLRRKHSRPVNNDVPPLRNSISSPQLKHTTTPFGPSTSGPHFRTFPLSTHEAATSETTNLNDAKLSVKSAGTGAERSKPATVPDGSEPGSQASSRVLYTYTVRENMASGWRLEEGLVEKLCSKASSHTLAGARREATGEAVLPIGYAEQIGDTAAHSWHFAQGKGAADRLATRSTPQMPRVAASPMPSGALPLDISLLYRGEHSSVWTRQTTPPLRLTNSGGAGYESPFALLKYQESELARTFDYWIVPCRDGSGRVRAELFNAKNFQPPAGWTRGVANKAEGTPSQRMPSPEVGARQPIMAGGPGSKSGQYVRSVQSTPSLRPVVHPPRTSSRSPHLMNTVIVDQPQTAQSVIVHRTFAAGQAKKIMVQKSRTGLRDRSFGSSSTLLSVSS